MCTCAGDKRHHANVEIFDLMRRGLFKEAKAAIRAAYDAGILTPRDLDYLNERTHARLEDARAELRALREDYKPEKEDL